VSIEWKYMLVLANGAFKSGSTWLYYAAGRLTGFPPPPNEFRNPSWLNSNIDPDKLADALARLDYHVADYMAKTHFGKREQRDLILSYDDVYVLNIKRDMRDVVVSAYYHECRNSGYEGSFQDFYWQRGRKVAQQVADYHEVWSAESSRIHTSSFERMLEYGADELRRIGDFLGFHPTDDAIEEILAFLQIEHVRKATGQEHDKIPFFRKGVAGDWKNHFTAEITEDFEEWCLNSRQRHR
jgi:hypothetical protein